MLLKESRGRSVPAARERDVFMDSAKGALIVLVVFGHALEYIFGIESGDAPEVARSMIYCFHMPLFILISGYYSKNAEKAARRAVATCLVPYAIFDFAWVVVTQRTALVDLLTPSYAFWLMLSLFFWRALIVPLSRVRHILVLSIAVGLCVGFVGSADRFLAASRTLAFLPFFIFGYKLDASKLAKLRANPSWRGVALFGLIEMAVADYPKSLT